jgi:2-keto-4-pentenoate hydratase/2-oxohepta-3-ene-1,7-dioic acid hydratase in catechol pathway
MRIVRVFTDGDARYGLADDSTITLITDEPFAAWETEEVIPLEGAHLMPPVTATKIVCVGLNYHEHAAELGMKVPSEPVLFLKPPTAINGPGAKVNKPERVSSVDYEAELAVVIGRRTHRVAAKDADHHILGFMCGNDITARELQVEGGQWTAAKAWDGFCPVGPWIDTDVDPSDLAIEAVVNGEVRQSARTSDMIFGVPELVSYVSEMMTLLPGDVIMTGTPPGVGPMTPGDRVEIRIEGIGSLVNEVV